MLVKLDLVGGNHIIVRDEAIDGLGPEDMQQKNRRLMLRGGQEVQVKNSPENLKKVEQALNRDQQI